MPKKSESGIILGFLLGFTSFFLYDTFNDEKKKLRFLKDLEKLKKEYSPYLIEFRRRLMASKELDKSIKELDKVLGSNLYDKIINYNETKTVEVKEKNTTRSIKKFFGVQ